MRRHQAPDRGSVLMLMPAAVVIVLLLGAIAVDSAIVYLEQRQAYNVAFDAANDAAGAAIDLSVARSSGDIVYDPTRLRSVAATVVDDADIDDLRLVDVTVTADGSVEVIVEYRASRLFTPAFGGRSSDRLEISATTEGRLRVP